MTRMPRFEIVRTDDGYLVRLKGANGKIILSSTSQMYRDREDAERAVDIAMIDAATQPCRFVDERTQS